jgi:hypothetical protein
MKSLSLDELIYQDRFSQYNFECTKARDAPLQEFFVQIFQRFIDHEFNMHVQSIVAEHMHSISVAAIASHFNSYCILHLDDLVISCPVQVAEEVRQIISERVFPFERMVFLLQQSSIGTYGLYQTIASASYDRYSIRGVNAHNCFLHLPATN